MSENKRLKLVRMKLSKSQTDFSNDLGIKQGSYSAIENGKVGVSGSIKKIIESKYRISINWLETGQGEMFINIAQPELNYTPTDKQDYSKENTYLRQEIERLKNEIIELNKELIFEKEKLDQERLSRIKILEEFVGYLKNSNNNDLVSIT